MSHWKNSRALARRASIVAVGLCWVIEGMVGFTLLLLTLYFLSFYRMIRIMSSYRARES